MITSIDLRRITQLLFNSSMLGKLQILENKLFKSTIILPEDVPRNLVTMNTEVAFEDLTTSENHCLRLVYQLSPLYGDQTSIFSPLGTSLLGMMLNEKSKYRLKDGSYREIVITDLVFQPEANYQYEL